MPLWAHIYHPCLSWLVLIPLWVPAASYVVDIQRWKEATSTCLLSYHSVHQISEKKILVKHLMVLYYHHLKLWILIYLLYISIYLCTVTHPLAISLFCKWDQLFPIAWEHKHTHIYRWTSGRFYKQVRMNTKTCVYIFFW